MVFDTLFAVKPIVCAVLLLGLATTVRADDILAGGTYYYRAHLENITAETVTVVHSSGRNVVMWSSLSTEAQRKYAKAHEDAIRQQAVDAQAKEEAAKMQAIGAPMLGGRIISIIPNEGILLLPPNSRQAALLRGFDPKDLADGDSISPMMVVADGTYSYETPKGTRATVHAYKVAPKTMN